MGDEAEAIEVHELDNHLIFAYGQLTDLIEDYLNRRPGGKTQRVELLNKLAVWLAGKGFDYLADRILNK